MKENLVRDIIQKLHELCGYEFFELSGEYGLLSSWGAALRNESGVKALVFIGAEEAGSLPVLNTGEIMEELYHIFHTGFIDLTVVVFAEENKFNYGEAGFRTIAVDYLNGKIEYYASDSKDTAEHVAYAMDRIRPGNSRHINSKLPVVTIVLMALNIMYFLVSAALSGSVMDISTEVLVFLGAKYNSGIASGQYYRLITCMFLHGGLIHIVLNMYSLYAIGPLVERVYGKMKYLLIYFIGGISASLLSYLMSPSISIGASGAIFALLGACLVLAVKMKKRIGKNFFNNILTVIVINLVIGLSLPNIDNFGHVGGLLGGIVTALAVFSGLDRDEQ